MYLEYRTNSTVVFVTFLHTCISHTQTTCTSLLQMFFSWMRLHIYYRGDNKDHWKAPSESRHCRIIQNDQKLFSNFDRIQTKTLVMQKTADKMPWPNQKRAKSLMSDEVASGDTRVIPEMPRNLTRLSQLAVQKSSTLKITSTWRIGTQDTDKETQTKAEDTFAARPATELRKGNLKTKAVWKHCFVPMDQ